MANIVFIRATKLDDPDCQLALWDAVAAQNCAGLPRRNPLVSILIFSGSSRAVWRRAPSQAIACEDIGARVPVECAKFADRFRDARPIGGRGAADLQVKGVIGFVVRLDFCGR